MYIIKFSKQADKDKKLLKGAGLEEKAKQLLNIITVNPFQNPPPYEKTTR
jgi:Txe/YoeB family toxin of Txe-Axe toxin-antitoxin module